MIFKIEIDLEWIGDQGLDGEVQDKLVNEIVNSLQDGIVKQLKNEVVSTLNGKIDGFIDDTLKTFMDRVIVVTDKWGNEQDRFESVNELLEAKFDNFLTQQVDGYGKAIEGCRTSGDNSRIAFMLDKRIQDKAESLTKSIALEVDKKIKVTLEKAVREKLSSTLLGKIDVDGIIKKVTGI